MTSPRRNLIAIAILMISRNLLSKPFTLANKEDTAFRDLDTQPIKNPMTNINNPDKGATLGELVMDPRGSTTVAIKLPHDGPTLPVSKVKVPAPEITTASVSPLPTTMGKVDGQSPKTSLDDAKYSQPRLITVFDEVASPDASLEDKIIAVEKRVCGNTCHGLSTVIGSQPIIGEDGCQKCFCDFLCEEYQDCCPDLVIRQSVTLGDQVTDCIQLISTGADERNKPDLKNSMITGCSKTINDETSEDNLFLDPSKQDISKCQNPNPYILEEAVPVTDSTTYLTYRNLFCFKCNSVNDSFDSRNTSVIVPWNMNIVCNGKPDLLLRSQPTKAQLFQMMQSPDVVKKTGCHLEYYPADRKFKRGCRKPIGTIISTCNATGLWDEVLYDERIVKACNMYTSLFLKEYKNIFCYICNVNYGFSIDILHQMVHRGDNSNTARLSFSALFQVSDEGYDRASRSDHQGFEATCSTGQFWNNVTCSCQGIKCSGGKYYDEEEDVCEDILGPSNIIGYQACIKINIETYGAISLKDIERLEHLFRARQIFLPSLNCTMTVSNWCPGARNIEFYIDSLEMQHHGVGTFKDLEIMFNEKSQSICDIVSYADPVLGQIVTCKVNIVEVCPPIGVDSLPCQNLDMIALQQRHIYAPLRDDIKYILAKITFYSYLPTNECPYVVIPASEFHLLNHYLVHSISGNQINEEEADFINDSKHARICLDDYRKWSKVDISECLTPSDADDFDTWTTSGIISIVCSSISLLFLLLTFITYILFDQIRSGGGKSIMVLTATLFVAISLYEFAIEQYEIKTLCTLIGISIHYFWLAAVFAMNACSLERFYKLCYPLRSRAFFLSKKSFPLFIAYTFLWPVAIVTINIVANLAVTQKSGYGSPTICYITERYSRIFSFLVPMCVVVLFNLCIFVITIVRLRKQTRPGSKKNSSTRVGFVACVRLSVVTGATWMISLLYDVVRSETMGYIFTALLGLQGMVLFFSIVVNKKVMTLYQTLLSEKVHGVMQTSPGSSTNSTTNYKRNLLKKKNKNETFDNNMKGDDYSSKLDTEHTGLSMVSNGENAFTESEYPENNMTKQ